MLWLFAFFDYFLIIICEKQLKENLKTAQWYRNKTFNFPQTQKFNELTTGTTGTNEKAWYMIYMLFIKACSLRKLLFKIFLARKTKNHYVVLS